MVQSPPLLLAAGRQRLCLLLLLRLVLTELGDKLVDPPLVALRLFRREVRVTLGKLLSQAGLIRLGPALLGKLTGPVASLQEHAIRSVQEVARGTEAHERHPWALSRRGNANRAEAWATAWACRRRGR
jgi:hypothetical protein